TKSERVELGALGGVADIQMETPDKRKRRLARRKTLSPSNFAFLLGGKEGLDPMGIPSPPDTPFRKSCDSIDAPAAVDDDWAAADDVSHLLNTPGLRATPLTENQGICNRQSIANNGVVPVNTP
ncbi:unnamed protein product, partial [Phaeothamnion confervicola]